MLKNSILMVLVLGLFAACEKEPTGPSDGSLITITNATFANQYPAVWFSPSTGEILPVGPDNEADATNPPESKYHYWVEPRDPEFASYEAAYANQDLLGIKYIGNGSDIFNTVTDSEAGGFSYDLFNTGNMDANNVFFIRSQEGDCVIQIIESRPADSYLQMDWKKIQ